MAGLLLPGESSHYGNSEGGPSRGSQERPEEGDRWYFSRKEIEENSPSRRDNIDLKKETYLRKSYCTFLQDLGMRLKVPQVTIATAIIFCHRFFIRQSHANNDRRTIATVCMFLAGKVEETPRPLKDVIVVSYEIMHKKDPAAAQRIKQKEVYEQQKELILIGERVVLATLGFDFNVHHPYKPLVEAIKKFKVAQNALAQVAWNFVNDGLRTSLCLQFKPHHIAAGAIFLAAKFLKVKLPSDGEKVWWQEFDVTPRQLEEVSNQMLELYEQNRVPQSQGSEVEGSAGGGSGHRQLTRTPAVSEDHVSKQALSRAAPEPVCQDINVAPPRNTHTQNNENGSGETESVITDHKVEVETRDNQHHEHVSHKELTREDPNKVRYEAEQIGEEDQKRTVGRNEGAEAGEWRDDAVSRKSSSIAGRNLDREGPVNQSPKDAIKMIDKDKVKAALEKRKKSRGETTRKKDIMDEDDLIERELEDGVELAAENEKIKRERRQSWSNNDHAETGDGNHVIMKGQSSRGLEAEYVEEGEMLDDASPVVNGRKRKGSPAERQSEGKRRHDYIPNHNRDTIEDGHKMGKSGYVDREHRRHSQDNHL
ncbi:PREDICTED: cyclin-T1-4-like [Populus euphratica]|uniref:B-like cyclin n=1 Tax=Populus euphratica TaxID=75702 RepID=A0AAJ6XKK6_POPEU|nr:PREDICTED: cyclin-T1-4-like [Populus euphratica]